MTARKFFAQAALAPALLAAFAFLPLARPARAANAAPGLDRYVGTYRYAGTKEEGIAIVDKALDVALGDMNMVMKAMAKRGAAQRFAEVIVIEGDAGKLGIKIGDHDKVTVGLGKTETVKSAEGKPGKATHAFDGKKLTETITGDDGTVIVNVFQLSADGKTLTRDVSVTSSRMAKPLKYRLLYARK